MTTFEFTSGFALETVRVMVALVGGVTPPGVPPVLTDGVVGDSDLHPAKITISARSANVSFRCLISIISNPRQLFHPPYEQPPHEKQKSSVNRVFPATRSPASVCPKNVRITSMVMIGLPVSGS